MRLYRWETTRRTGQIEHVICHQKTDRLKTPNGTRRRKWHRIRVVDVIARLKADGVTGTTLTEFESMTGRGLSGQHENKSYWVGNDRLLMECGLVADADTTALATHWREQAKTVVYFADETQVLAVLAITDPVKETSREAIATL